jgi:hypothetical protein
VSDPRVEARCLERPTTAATTSSDPTQLSMSTAASALIAPACFQPVVEVQSKHSTGRDGDCRLADAMWQRNGCRAAVLVSAPQQNSGRLRRRLRVGSNVLARERGRAVLGVSMGSAAMENADGCGDDHRDSPGRREPLRGRSCAAACAASLRPRPCLASLNGPFRGIPRDWDTLLADAFAVDVVDRVAPDRGRNGVRGSRASSSGLSKKLSRSIEPAISQLIA